MSDLVLIDGHHLMYRGYFAIPRTLKTSKGEQVNMIFGVASMILAILKKEEPDALLFCFDAGEETFRHAECPSYKEGRAETPDDFYAQIPRVIEMLGRWGIRHVSDPLFEADDFLCSYAIASRKAGMRVKVVTGDRDALQLVQEGVTMVIPHKGYAEAEYLDMSGVERKYGVRPDQITDYKGLTGDPSDNLPGVKGIGPKTAAKLLQEYHSLEGVYTHVNDLPKGVRDKLEHDREQAFFCQKLSQLVCDIPLPIPLRETHIAGWSAKKIVEFFEEMEFTLLTRRLQELIRTEYGQKAFVETKGTILPPLLYPPPKGEVEEQMPLFG